MTSLRPAVVEEVDIDGDVVAAISSAAQVTVGFIGAVLEIEQDYRDQRSACWTAMLRPYTKNHLITGRLWRQESVNYRVELLTLEIPCYARVFNKKRHAMWPPSNMPQRNRSTSNRRKSSLTGWSPVCRRWRAL
jgi:hypothetical protein